LVVPPAELEHVLITHPDIADAAVIGIQSEDKSTELPRAYVVHAQPARLTTVESKRAFEESVAKWVESKVARHKYLRGGESALGSMSI
jgi:4-coumarate--CoA ligase